MTNTPGHPTVVPGTLWGESKLDSVPSWPTVVGGFTRKCRGRARRRLCSCPELELFSQRGQSEVRRLEGGR